MVTKRNSGDWELLVAGVAALIMTIIIPHRPGGISRDRFSALPLSDHPTINVASTQEDRHPSMSGTIDLQVRRAGADESWWQMVSADLERQEYAASPTSDGLQAPNRAHNLRTIFREHGIEVVPRTGKDVTPAWRFAWQTTGLGRPGHMQEVSPSTPSAQGARVVYQRNGWSEWYENTAKGLEQGFTLQNRPDGEGALRIAAGFPASLRPEV